MSFTVDMAALLERASKRAAQHGYQATLATRLPEPTAEGSQVATVAWYPLPEQVTQGSQVATVAWYPASEQDTDTRVTCTSCANYSRARHRCSNHVAALLQGADIAPDLAVLKQHCQGWKGKP